MVWGQLMKDGVASTLIIAGRGTSSLLFDWSHYMGIPVMGVSSGCYAVPEMHHFVSLDKPLHFHEWVTDSTRFTKHVPKNSFWPYWEKCPRAVAFEYIEQDLPTFGRTSPVVTGPIRNHTLLAAVQVAARLGYTRNIFIGCDLLSPELYAIADVLKAWHPIAQNAGIEWLNASQISTLNEWMPKFENTGVLVGS
jgi:hypothetical protein